MTTILTLKLRFDIVPDYLYIEAEVDIVPDYPYIEVEVCSSTRLFWTLLNYALF